MPRTVGRKSRRARDTVIFLTLLLAGCGGGGGGSSIPPFVLFSSVAVADLNGDGLPDIAASYSYISGSPPHPGFVAVYLQDRAKPGTFLAGAIYGVGNDPASIAIGDLDGDGKADIVTSNAILSAAGAGASTVSVLLQDQLHPGQFLPAVPYATGFNPVSVSIGDLNNDGKPDLAVADHGGISLLLQNPAAPGTFLPRIAIGIGSPASSVSIADLNGDGNPDLVATNAISVLVLLHDPLPSGSFLVPTSYGAGAQPIYAAAGDLDADSKPDLAVANFGSPSDPRNASVSILRQSPLAPGTFLSAVNYATALRSQTVAIADLNGDGKADLAVSNSGTLAGLCPPNCGSAGTGVSVLLQNPALPGQFLSAANYPATGNDFVTWLVTADMNGDGKPDLVIAQSGGVFIRFQDPMNAGQFQGAISVQNLR
jgi:hypothetical protein